VLSIKEARTEIRITSTTKGQVNGWQPASGRPQFQQEI